MSILLLVTSLTNESCTRHIQLMVEIGPSVSIPLPNESMPITIKMDLKQEDLPLVKRFLTTWILRCLESQEQKNIATALKQILGDLWYGVITLKLNSGS